MVVTGLLRSPLTGFCCLRSLSDPVDGGGVNTVAVEGGKELLVTDLVKGFCEVHCY